MSFLLSDKTKSTITRTKKVIINYEHDDGIPSVSPLKCSSDRKMGLRKSCTRA